MMEKLFRALNFTPTLLQSFVNNLSPTAQNWADPFGGLIALGNQMVMVAMTALGLAGIASTTTGTAATTLFNALTDELGRRRGARSPSASSCSSSPPRFSWVAWRF